MGVQPSARGVVSVGEEVPPRNLFCGDSCGKPFWPHVRFGSAVAMPQVGRIGNAVLRTAVGAIVGGTISKVTGGKFANGAVSGAIQAAMAGSRDDNAKTKVRTINGIDPNAPMQAIPEDQRQGFLEDINEAYKLKIKSLRYDPRGESIPKNPGYTTPNGDVVINPIAFRQTYAGLVGSVWHEAFHVWQFASYQGRVPKRLFRVGTQTNTMMETEAYKYMGTAMNPAYEMYSPYELNQVQSAFDSYRSDLNEVNQLRVNHSDFNCARLSCGE